MATNYAPALQLNFARTKSLDPRITFSRADTGASQATYFGADGLLKYAGIGEPRFDHDPVTGESLGLLIEEQRANLLTYSEDFRNTTDAGGTRPWMYVSATITPNAITAPDGTLTADKLIENTIVSNHEVNQNFTPAASAAYTFSCFMKAAELSQGILRFTVNFGEAVVVSFSLTGSGSASTVFGSPVSSTITPVGNGWYRCAFTATSGGSPSSTGAYVSTKLGLAGTDNHGIYIWGAQLEAGAFPTSYISTTSAAVTRNPDIASMSGVNFSSWYNQSEGTMVMDASTPFAIPSTHFMPVFRVSDGTSGNRNQLSMLTESLGGFVLSKDGVTQCEIYPSGLSGVRRRRAAGAYKLNDFAASFNGATVLTDTIGNIPAVTQAEFGSTAPATTPTTLSGHIRRLTYYPKRLPNATLQALTK
jgi:hypothetical protein